MHIDAQASHEIDLTEAADQHLSERENGTEGPPTGAVTDLALLTDMQFITSPVAKKKRRECITAKQSAFLLGTRLCDDS